MLRATKWQGSLTSLWTRISSWTKPESLCSAQMVKPSQWYLICLQRDLLMSVDLPESMAACVLTPRSWAFITLFPVCLSWMLSTSGIHWDFLHLLFSFPNIVCDTSTFSVFLTQAIPVAALIYPQVKSLEKQQQHLTLPNIQDSAGVGEENSSN